MNNFDNYDLSHLAAQNIKFVQKQQKEVKPLTAKLNFYKIPIQFTDGSRTVVSVATTSKERLSDLIQKHQFRICAKATLDMNKTSEGVTPKIFSHIAGIDEEKYGHAMDLVAYNDALEYTDIVEE